MKAPKTSMGMRANRRDQGEIVSHPENTIKVGKGDRAVLDRAEANSTKLLRRSSQSRFLSR